MGRRTVVIGIVAVVVLIAIGVSVYMFFFRGGVGVKGFVNITSIELYVDCDRVSEDITPIEIYIDISNGFPIDVDVSGGRMDLYVNGLRTGDISIPSTKIGRGVNRLVIDFVLSNDLIDDVWYRHLKNNESSVAVLRGGIGFKTPIGDIEIPIDFGRNVSTHIFPIEEELDREVDLGVLGKIIIKSIRIELENISLTETGLRAHLAIENRLKAIPLYINWIAFRVKINDIAIAEGRQETATSIAPGEIDSIPFTISLENTKIPLAWYKHIKNRERSDISIEIWLEINIAGKTIEILKENPLTIKTSLETNIFKYKE
ncbi:hypothetical protein Igag_0704 [Ignisphaera aggregans DSM 17230]|uniref:Uncharacterized protein n=1 Tax=Ignisphaera aggregans (strain DSM 17230 / JCM 13409 / AQ1.S1) TaxID=583356 RepID=E0SSY4_IGNAA|nr:hypothetical protein Igag_0704 [Ignisphaera aggregans DSM 17230]